MTSLLLAAPALAGSLRLCSTTDARASAHGSWDVLAARDRDEADDVQAGTGMSIAQVEVSFGDDRTADLCPYTDPEGGVLLASLGQMLEVSLPTPGEPRSCMTRAWAIGDGSATARAQVDGGRIHAQAAGTVDMAIDAGNSGRIDADAGGGATFTGEWAYGGGGPNTVVAGTIHVAVEQAYGGAWVEVPGLAQVRAWDGRIEAMLRRGDRWERWEGAAPADLEFDAVLHGRRGTICATGGLSVGAVTDRESVAADGAVDVDIDTAASTTAPTWITGERPDFGPCGCR